MPQPCIRVKVYDPDGTEFFYETKSGVPFQGHLRHLFENLIEYSASFQCSSLRQFSDTDGLISSHYGLQEASSGLWIEDSNDTKFQKEDNILFFKLKPLNKYISDVETLLPPPLTTSPTASSPVSGSPATPSPLSGTPGSQPSSLRSHIESQIQTQFKIRATTLTAMLASVSAPPLPPLSTTPAPSSKAAKKALRKAIESLHIHLTLLMLKERTRNDHVFISSDNLVKIIRIIFRSPTLWSINLLVDYLQRNNNNININNNTKSSANNTNYNYNYNDISPSSTLNKNFGKKTAGTSTVQSNNSTTPAQSSTPSGNNNSGYNNSNSNSNSQYSNRDSLGLNQDASNGNQISLFTLIDQCIKMCSLEFKKNFYSYLIEQYEQRRDSVVDSDGATDNNERYDDDFYFNKAIRASESIRSLSSSMISIPNLHSEIIIQTISLINNIYILSPNPVNYVSKLHKDNIFRSLYDLKVKDNLISNSIQYKALRNNLVCELRDQCIDKVDTERIQHQILFSDLWSATLTLYPFGGCSSYKWLLLGFRGANPSDDLSCTGVIALRNLNYFAKQHPYLFKHILAVQTERESNQDDEDDSEQELQILSKSYPVALVGISLSYILSQAYEFRVEKQRNDSIAQFNQEEPSTSTTPPIEDDQDEKWNIVFSDYHWFDECYVSTYALFEALWSLQSVSYTDFSTILSTTQSIIKATINKKPVSSQEFTEYVVGALLECTEVTNAIDVVDKFNELLANDSSAIKDTAYSCHNLIRFFGESLDSLSYQFLPPNMNQKKFDSLMERNNRIETFIGEWLGTEQVEYKEKLRFSMQVQESLLTASLMNSGNGNGIVNSQLKNVQNGGSSQRNSNSMPSTESRLNKLNKFFGEKVHLSQLGSSSDGAHNTMSSTITTPTPTPSNFSATATAPSQISTSAPTSSYINLATNNNNNEAAASVTASQLKTRSPEEMKSLDKVQRLLGEKIDFKKENISFIKLNKPQQPPSPQLESANDRELLPAEPIAIAPTSDSPSSANASTSPISSSPNKAWRKGTMTSGKPNYHSSVMIPLSLSPSSVSPSIHVVHSSPVSSSPSHQNFTLPSTPDIHHQNPLRESVDNNPPSCRASVNSSMETLDVISDHSSYVDEDDKLNIFYQERFDNEPSHSPISNKQLQQVTPDLQQEPKIMSDRELLQQLEDELSSPVVLPGTKPMERHLITELELDKPVSTANGRNPDLVAASETSSSYSDHSESIAPTISSLNMSPIVDKPLNLSADNNHNPNSKSSSSPRKQSTKSSPRSAPNSPLNTSPNLSSSPRPITKTVQIGGPDSPIKITLRKTSTPLPSSAPSSPANESPRNTRPRSKTSKAPPELKKSHTVNSLSDPKLIATNEHSPSVSSLITVFGEKIQRRG